MDRDTIFECYLTRKVVNQYKDKPKKPSASHREIHFAHGRKMGHSWLESEVEWQKRKRK